MGNLGKTLIAGCGVLALAGALTVSAGDVEARQWRRGGYGGGYGAGAAAAGIIGGLALGAMAAQAAQPRPEYIEGGCYSARRRVWSEYQGRYVVRRVRVCD